MDVRSANLTRKRLPCLRCARLFWTDRCHRICAKCHRLRRTHGLWDLLSDLYGLEESPEEREKSASRLPAAKGRKPRPFGRG